MADFKINSLEGKQVLITGGLGFIGSNTAHRCIELGAETTLLSNSLSKTRNIKEILKKVKIVQADIRDEKKVVEAVKGKDLIFHFAGQISNLVSMKDPQLDVDINCIGTLNLLEAARRFADAVPIVMSGTTGQVGKPEKLPVNESLPDKPTSIYDANKLVCEKYLKIYFDAYGIPTTMLRLANVFGPRQQVLDPKSGVLNHMVKRAMVGEPITIYGEGNFLRDYNFVENVVDAFLLAAQSKAARGEHFVLGTGRGIAFKDMCNAVNETVKQFTGKSTEIKHVPFPDEVKKVDVGDFVADSSKFRKATGWFPKISFEEGLEKTVLFYKERLQDYLK